MKVRNTTDYDTDALRSLIRVVVRDVERTMAAHHPLGLGWTPEMVAARAKKILGGCDVWIRQHRARRTSRGARDYGQEAARAAEKGQDDRALRLAVFAETGGGSSGYAMLSGSRLRLTLSTDSTASFLWLVRHEAWHLFGVGHEDFPNAVMHETPSSREAIREQYAAQIARYGETLPAKPARVAPPPPSAEERAASKLARIEEREKAWTTKLRRAQTALAKLKKSRRYYEKLAARPTTA